jgi:hypothetical protein
VTHPFHPLARLELAALEIRKSTAGHGEDKVWFQLDGRQGAIPRDWTSFGDEDPFVVLNAGRSLFRVADLLELADLVDSWRHK